MSQSSLSLTSPGDTTQLVATVKDAGGTTVSGATVTWSTSSTAIATVSSGGLVTSVGDGTATITATSGSINGTATATVTCTTDSDNDRLYNCVETNTGTYVSASNTGTNPNLVDTDGVAITSKELDRFQNLLIVVGEGAPKATPTLLAMIASQPSLVSKVAAATLIGKRRWNVMLKGGIKIRLPEKDPHKAWQHLAHLNTKHKLLARDVNMIDMRLPRRLLIRPGVLGTQTTSFKGQKT